MTGRRLSVIACPSLRLELETLAAEMDASIAFHHLEMSLHERSGDALREALQTAIDQTAPCEAIAIGYGLCNRGVVGIMARQTPLVIPRAHDCLAILLGSARRYLEEVEKEPGTYFQSAGWLNAARDVRQPEFTFGPNSNVRYEELAARYGEEAANYLMKQFKGFTKNYRRLCFIATPTAGNYVWEAQARDIAEERNWTYHRLEGDAGWMQRLLSGTWNEAEFLVVQPGQRVTLSGGDRLIDAA